ncbi:MAG: hypothetical protein M1574_03220 [Gammaproteobacteria bacterium]|nr:hypothetical protein [Gammaproteobacteria bacterium]
MSRHVAFFSSRRPAKPVLFVLLLVLVCAGCTPFSSQPPVNHPYLHLSPAILILAQQVEILRLERHNPSHLSSPLARVDRAGRLDLAIGYRGRKQPVLTALRGIGALIVAKPAEGHRIEAWIPARHVASLARIPGIVLVRFPTRAHGGN